MSAPRAFAPFPGLDHAELERRGEPFVLLETALPRAEEHNSYLFSRPMGVIEARGADEVPAALDRIEEETAHGRWLAGFLSYELGHTLEKRLSDARWQSHRNTPLIWLGVFPEPAVFDHLGGGAEGRDAGLFRDSSGPGEMFAVENPSLDVSESEYLDSIERIKRYIESGDVYQVNYTCRYGFTLGGSPRALYRHLLKKQRVPYAAFLDTGGQSGLRVLSISPELFLRTEGGVAHARPMKGTIRRGRTEEEDLELSGFLKGDIKNRSENVMIVDLMRNDLGRISRTGGVSVPSLFEIEPYETLYQMTSTVRAELREGLGYAELIRSVFPSGSVTGAPKIRAMEIIGELESSPRGVYTGAVGFFGPGGHSVLNVPIRTIVLEDEAGEMGVGSGVVYDSVGLEEYRECLLKADFLLKGS